MDNKDIRWIQRFANYKKALNQLTRFIEKGRLSEMEEQGLIKAFEYTYELGWNTIKDFYEDQGEMNVQGSKDAIRIAFTRGLISDGEGWFDMVKSRTKTAHAYNEAVAHEIAVAIKITYFHLFNDLRETLEPVKENAIRDQR